MPRYLARSPHDPHTNTPEMRMKQQRPPEFYTEIVSFRGLLSGSEVGAKFGLTRNAVIGIWNRSNAPLMTPEQCSRMMVRAQQKIRERRERLERWEEMRGRA